MRDSDASSPLIILIALSNLGRDPDSNSAFRSGRWVILGLSPEFHQSNDTVRGIRCSSRFRPQKKRNTITGSTRGYFNRCADAQLILKLGTKRIAFVIYSYSVHVVLYLRGRLSILNADPHKWRVAYGRFFSGKNTKCVPLSRSSKRC